jgi:hypothetical protein
MKKILFLVGILCILASCKKKHVEPIIPEHKIDSVNTLPSFVYTTQSNNQNKTVYRFSYYPNGLLKKIIQYDSVYNPDQKDSTLYTYNINNKVIETSQYSDGNLTYKTEITYNYTGNIETVLQQNKINQVSTKYQYIYAAVNDVAYVLKYDAANTITDSIVVEYNAVTKYFKPTPIETQYYSVINGYASLATSYFFKTPGGVYINKGVRTIDPNTYVYNDNSIAPVCINKNIDFQYEVAEKFIELGLKTFPERNFYIIPEPLQYCTYYVDPTSGHLNTYKFDQDNRLIQIYGRFDYYGRAGTPIPGSLITEIRY